MKDTKVTNLAILDCNTGEIKKNLTVEELKMLDRYEDTSGQDRKLNSKVKRKDKTEFKSLINKEFGSFYFAFYNNLKEKDYIFRFLYLCTYMNYKNYLVFGAANGIANLARKKDIIEILKPLSKRSSQEVISYLLTNKLIFITKERYVLINKEFCNRGRTNKLTSGSVRMVDKSLQELYKCSNVKEHKTINFLIKILPYVNPKFNIVCLNPLEEDITKVKPLKQVEILKILGVSKKVITQLVQLKICNEKESVFCKVSNAFVKNAFVINPRFCFNSRSKDDLEKELELFKLGSNIKRG